MYDNPLEDVLTIVQQETCPLCGSGLFVQTVSGTATWLEGYDRGLVDETWDAGTDVDGEVEFICSEEPEDHQHVVYYLPNGDVVLVDS